nr:hypothetical protein [uncultured Cohaesibacter sp.]
MSRSAFGERFAVRSKGLAGYFGKPFDFIGVNGAGWSSLAGRDADDDPVSIFADLVTTESLDDTDLQGSDEHMRAMLANHDVVISIHVDEASLPRLPRDKDKLKDGASGPVYTIERVLDEENGWLICGCGIEALEE